MKIGILKEIKNNEYRVGLTDSEVKQLSEDGHSVVVENNSGLGCQISNELYEKAGAKILQNASDVYSQSDMIIKVKEPLKKEYDLLRENQILYTFLHLAAESELTQVLCDKKIQAIAYETIEDSSGQLPLLVPMSEVAGRMATQVGSFYLQKNAGGKGLLMGGVTGTARAKVCILGGGIVGANAAKIAVGLGADTCVLDVNPQRLRYLDDIYQGRLKTFYSNIKNIEMCVREADLLIGAVLVTGRKAPHLVSKDLVSQMSKDSVVVDVSVDQGGCVESCYPTTHENPTFKFKDVLHYCVPNIPGIVPISSTYALTSASFYYARKIAGLGLERALESDKGLLKGLNVYKGYVTYGPVAEDLNVEYKSYAQMA